MIKEAIATGSTVEEAKESAAKELKNMLPLMLPYEYCPQFYPNIETLIKIKKRLGLF